MKVVDGVIDDLLFVAPGLIHLITHNTDRFSHHHIEYKQNRNNVVNRATRV